MDKIKEHASETIVSGLGRQTATKDQAAITEDIANGGGIGEIYGLGEAGLFDEFFFFLREIGVMSLFAGLEPSKVRQRSSNVKFSAVILIYLMRIVSGLRFFWHIEPVESTAQCQGRGKVRKDKAPE